MLKFVILRMLWLLRRRFDVLRLWWRMWWVCRWERLVVSWRRRSLILEVRKGEGMLLRMDLRLCFMNLRMRKMEL